MPLLLIQTKPSRYKRQKRSLRKLLPLKLTESFIKLWQPQTKLSKIQLRGDLIKLNKIRGKVKIAIKKRKNNVNLNLSLMKESFL